MADEPERQNQEEHDPESEEEQDQLESELQEQDELELEPQEEQEINGASLAEAVELAYQALAMCTGHDEYDRLKISFYFLATYFIYRFDPFPTLGIYGPPSTGKSVSMMLGRYLCKSPVPVTGETITAAALRRCMADADGGSLLIEEGDKISTAYLENMLTTRYSRESAKSTKMVPDGNTWVLEDLPTYGATIVHIRNLFRDPALLRRVIAVKTKRQQRNFSRIEDCLDLTDQFRAKLTRLPHIPDPINEWEVEAGVFECYRPLVALASFTGHDEFLGQLVKEMRAASERLREEEAYLEAPTLLKVLIGLAESAAQHRFTLDLLNIPIRNIRTALYDEFGRGCPALALSNVQRNRILRDDFGFTIKSSHSRNRVYFTIPQLLAVCDEWGVKDELLEEWRKELEDMGRETEG